MQDLIEKIKSDERYKNISLFLDKERVSKEIYPPKEVMLSSIENIGENLKVVILGQDPYHNPGQANGLSFSVAKNVKKIPPSLQNIFKELKSDINDVIISGHGDLSSWSKQGVLLLNSTLSVEKNKPNSHSKIGWQDLTDDIIRHINDNYDGIVFILWGSYAIKKSELLDPTRHLILTSSHPSPFSARKSFFGSKPFSKTNEYLNSLNKGIINWNIL